jgi:DNA invertase Pin-like site-specific DNA recombinase
MVQLVFGMFAVMADYEAALVRERTQAGLAAARARGRHGGRKPKMTPALIARAQRMYDSRQFTIGRHCRILFRRPGDGLSSYLHLL